MTSEVYTDSIRGLKHQIDIGDKYPTRDDVKDVCAFLLREAGYDYTFQWVRQTIADFSAERTDKRLNDLIRERNINVRNRIG